jgi:hypothetical protein
VTAPLFVRAAEAATLLGLPDAAALLRRRAALEAMGFPAPMPHSARPLLWRRDSVAAWAQAASQLAADGRQPFVAGGEANDAAMARSASLQAAAS